MQGSNLKNTPESMQEATQAVEKGSKGGFVKEKQAIKGPTEEVTGGKRSEPVNTVEEIPTEVKTHQHTYARKDL